MGGGASSSYAPIADHGLIGDCHSAALVRSDGTIDWCCLPRFDSHAVFGSLLDAREGGSWALDGIGVRTRHRRYLEGTLVLESTVEVDGGRATITDLFSMRRGGGRRPRRELVRIVEGVEGTVRFRTAIRPRFDYGQTRPWVREHRDGSCSAVGSSNGLVIAADVELRVEPTDGLIGEFEVSEGERRALSLRFQRPESIPLDDAAIEVPDQDAILAHRDETIEWWRGWSSRRGLESTYRDDAIRSAIVLKALINAPMGAMIAAPTTSLPEHPGGVRNWDYRYCWIRDSSFAVRALDALRFTREAVGFRRFVERTVAGRAEELQILYGIGGERRVPELTLDHLEGYGGARPVRIGNAAASQFRLDIYGELVDLAWEWHVRDHAPEPDYWRFLVGIVDHVVRAWHEPDRGIWEVRGEPQHFVHSKAMCWVVLDRAIRLAEDLDLDNEVPVERWIEVRDEIRERIETDGYDERRGVFRRSFGHEDLDGSLLLLPQYGIVSYDDPRMIMTTNAVRDELGREGLIRRYMTEDGVAGDEGTFVACTFWLVTCLARQGRNDEAVEWFERASATANDLGLFSEEFDIGSREMLGNFPQALSHLAHIDAIVELAAS